MKPVLFLVHLGLQSEAADGPEPAPGERAQIAPEPANQPFVWTERLRRATATEIFVAFDENAAHAERTYGGRPLAIVGAVERVLRRGGGFCLRLSVSGRPGAYLACALTGRGAEGVDRLRPGDVVLVAAQRVRGARCGATVDHGVLVDTDVIGVARDGGR